MNVKFCNTSLDGLLRDYFECRDILLDALATGDGRVDEALLVDGLVKGDYQLWRTPNSAGVTQIARNPISAVVFVFLSAGDLEEVLHACTEAVEPWARELGCTAVLMSGRKGWEKVLKPRGYEFQSMNLIKKL